MAINKKAASMATIKVVSITRSTMFNAYDPKHPAPCFRVVVAAFGKQWEIFSTAATRAKAKANAALYAEKYKLTSVRRMHEYCFRAI